jgi:hypothetical protein
LGFVESIEHAESQLVVGGEGSPKVGHGGLEGYALGDDHEEALDLLDGTLKLPDNEVRDFVYDMRMALLKGTIDGPDFAEDEINDLKDEIKNLEDENTELREEIDDLR